MPRVNQLPSDYSEILMAVHLTQMSMPLTHYYFHSQYMIHDSLQYGPKLLDLITPCPLGWETSGRNVPCHLGLGWVQPASNAQELIINGTRNYSNGSIGFSAHNDLVLFPNCPNTNEPPRPTFSDPAQKYLELLPLFSSRLFQNAQMLLCSSSLILQCPLLFFNPNYISFGIQADTAKKQGQQSSLQWKLIQIYKIKNSNKCWTPEANIMLCYYTSIKIF